MSVLILDHAAVKQLLPMDECIVAMEGALSALAEGQVYMPLRTVVRPPDMPGVMGLMPAYVGGEHPAFGLKAVAAFPGNRALGKDSHQGAVLLYSPFTGETLAIMNAGAITSTRTAAISGVATRLLAREDAGVLAIVGAGTQARAHLEAMACVRSLRRVLVTDLMPDYAQEFVTELQPRYGFPIEVAPSAETAVREADLVVTVTTSKEPVLMGAWLQPGAHVNVVGGSTPMERELDGEAVARSSLFVDRRESTINESADYLGALREGAISGPEHIKAEVGEVLLGWKPGRTSAREITMFKSLGLAVEDVISAAYLYEKAQESGAGTWVEL
jgi:ornithine cyclodeaminase/alanine dehydrogenase-like protein (mu-crystallin family)